MLKGPLVLTSLVVIIILKWVNYTFLVCICFEMLSHLFGSFLISWTCVDVVKGIVISLPMKNRIAIQPRQPSILKVYLHDVLLHIVFLFSSFSANMSPFCLFPISGALCFGEDFCSAVAAILAAACFEALSPLAWDPVVKWEKSSMGAGLDCPHFVSSATEELLLRRGRACLPPPSWGLKAGSMILTVAEIVVARKW